jgi:hypothetical protein
MTPKTLPDRLEEMVSDGGAREQAMLCFVLALVKCSRIYFFEANNALCFRAYLRQRLWMLSRILQLSSVVLPKARALMLLMRPTPENG